MRIPIRVRQPVALAAPDPPAPRRARRTSAIDGDTVKVRMGWAFRAKFPRADVSRRRRRTGRS